jgi:predicted helicase
MRKNLLESFDSIYILDLHGNSKKQEICPDGSPDQNVFDIMQGVSINIFIKKGKKNGFGNLLKHDLYGKRDFKYNFLNESRLSNIRFDLTKPSDPNYFYSGINFENTLSYESGIALNKLFIENNAGLVTSRDKFIIQNTTKDVERIINEFAFMEEEFARRKYELGEDSRDWTIKSAQKDLIQNNLSKEKIKPIMYRPFDMKYLFYTIKSKGFISYPRNEILKHLKEDNLALISTRLLSSQTFQHLFISKSLIDKCSISNRGKETNYVFPVYLYPDDKRQNLISCVKKRKPNLNSDIVKDISKEIGATFTPEKEPTANTFAPIDILDYIYAVLHSPTYREKYKEFLKIDFPRVPYPKDAPTFWSLVEKGCAIRALHLLESPLLETFITTYPESGTNQVGKVRYDNGKVYINETQYFDKVPQIAWEFYIGGYQPAQKWLKDRKDRVLTFEDIIHYQKIIIALTETDRLMKEIDGLGIEW